MLLGHQRIIQFVVFIVKLDDRTGQNSSFFNAEAFGQRSRRNVAHHQFQRHNLDFLDQLFAHVDAFDEMGRNANLVQVLKNIFRNAVVEHAFAIDNLMLLGVERGCIIFEKLHQSAGFRAFIKNFGLAFVNFTASAHRIISCCLSV